MQKVAVLGSSGGIGQPLSLLMKQSLFVSELALYDIANAAGVAADISHIETRPVISGHTGPSELPAALTDAKVVLIPAGVPRKPGNLRFINNILMSMVVRFLVFIFSFSFTRHDS